MKYGLVRIKKAFVEKARGAMSIDKKPECPNCGARTIV